MWFLLTVADSPILGAASEIFAQIVIEANDNAHGILSLSASAIGVEEQTTEPLLYVNRSAGAFGMVRYYILSLRLDCHFPSYLPLMYLGSVSCNE